jgi:hypothetical protein
MIYYLPSCKIKALHPDSSIKMQNYLRKHGVEVVGCCKVSQNLFKQGDTVINNCTSCAIITGEQSPFVNNIALYEYLLNDPNFKWPNYNGENITVQDCYRTKDKPSVQKAIRQCLIKMNMVPIEIEENFEKTNFDGPFIYERVSPINLKMAPNYYGELDKHIKVLSSEEIKEKMETWVKQYETQRVVVYCNSCLKGVLLGGANGIHIIDLLAKDLED